MADYYQVRNENVFNPPANTNLGNASNQFGNVFVQNNLNLGNVTVTSSSIITPKVSTITYPGDDTAADTAGGQTITLTGSGFTAGASVLINGSAVGIVSVVNSTTITFTSPANSTGSYVIYVINPDGATAISIPGIQYSGTPNWTTAAGSLGNVYETNSFNQTVTATGDAPITYAVTSGSLPPGATFNSNGTITGTSSLLSSPTTYTFTVRATDAQQQDTDRSFNLVINPDVVTWSSPANGTTYTSATNSAISNVTLSATSAVGSGITYTANALPTGISLSGNTISGTPTVEANSSSLLTATANITSESSSVTINWVISVANDIYFEYNTLLLQGASTTFVDDASTNNFSVSILGDTKPNSFNPYTPGYYSNYFDSSSAISLPTTQTTTGSFTAECWFYRSADPVNYHVIFGGSDIGSGGTVNTQLTVKTTGAVGFVINAANGAAESATGVVPLGRWSHIVWVRSGTSCATFVNGSRVATGTSSGTLEIKMIGSGGNGAGAIFAPSYSSVGYISNARITTIAVYDPAQTTLTVPTSPLTAITGTTVLTCQSNRLIDNSSNAYVLTALGAPQIKSLQPFTPNSSYSTYGSAYFDGTGDYLSIPSTTALQFGTGDFTVESWVYLTATPSAQYAQIIGRTEYGSNADWMLQITNANKLTFYLGSTASFIVTSTASILLNTWTHVAVSRSSNSFKLFINGVVDGTTTNAGSTDATGSGVYTIGSDQAGDEVLLTGYLSDLRAVKGTAVYTTTFTPPSQPLTAIANTSLLILQNNQSVNNSTFLDNSSNNFLVTRNGNSTQGTFSPYGGNWSNYFDGAGDYLTVANNAALALGSGAFTVEIWLYILAYNASTSRIIDWRSNGGVPSNIPVIVLSASGVPVFYADVSTGALITGSSAIALNTWAHLAIVRSGSTVTMYLNGTSIGSASSSLNLGVETLNLNDPAAGSTYGQRGYFSNLRIVKGTAVYTSNFTLPTTPLTPITGTSLLTCQSNRLIDNSPNNFTITQNGDTSVQRFSPFGPSSVTPTSYSGYFDGTGDYLTVPSSSNFALGTGDFTIEAWINLSTLSNDSCIIDGRDGTGTVVKPLLFVQQTLGYTYFVNGSGTIQTGTPVLKTWTHIAVVRSSGTTKMYVNGTQIGSVADTNNYLTCGFRVGYFNDGVSTTGFNGYISNLRVVKGTAVYTSAFTPSTTPLTAISGTSLLTCQSPTFIDNSTNNFTISAFGNSQPTQQNPYGYTSATTEGYTVSTIGGSAYFAGGSGQYVDAVHSSQQWLSNANFTIECWFYVQQTSENTLVSKQWQGSSNAYASYLLYTNSSRVLQALFNTGGGWDVQLTGTTTIILNQWNHAAVNRTGNTWNLYLNGKLEATTTNSGTLVNATDNLRVGAQGAQTSAGASVLGYVSDLRITKGVGLYPSQFVPPSTPMVAVPNTMFLLNSTNAGIYDASMMNNMETVGDAKLSTEVSKFGGSSMYFDGTGDYLTVSPNITNNLGTGDFTIEAWVYLTSGSTYQFFIGSSDNASGYMMIGINVPLSPTSTIAIGRSGINWPVQFGAGTTITSNTWTHIAITRSGTTNRAFINGVQLGSNVTDSTNWTFPSNTMWVGMQSGGTAFNGFMDDFRVTRGYARYTANFTAPTQALQTF